MALLLRESILGICTTDPEVFRVLWVLVAVSYHHTVEIPALPIPRAGSRQRQYSISPTSGVTGSAAALRPAARIPRFVNKEQIIWKI